MKHAWVLLAFVGCADPAALEVRITIQDQDLDSLRLNVIKGDQPSGVSFIDCELPFEGEPTGTCPFEGGAGAWTNAERLSLVLYGEPGAPLTIGIDGFRAGRSVTATRAVSALPPSEGERRAIDLALFARTSERHRCNVEIPAAGTPTAEDDNALAVFNVTRHRAREVVVSANGNLGFAGMARSIEDGCVLGPVVTYVGAKACDTTKPPVSWCNLRPGAMAVGATRASDALVISMLVGGLCATPEHLIAAYLRNRCAEVKVLRLPAGVALADVSDPVVVDVDGDDDLEMVVTYLDRAGIPAADPAPMSVLVWHPERARGAMVTTPLPNTVSHVAHRPMFVPSRQRTTMVFPATNPAFTLWSEAGIMPTTGIEVAEMARAPALVAGIQNPGIVRVRTDGIVEWIQLSGGSGEVVARYSVDRTLTVDLDIRVAVGKRGDGDRLSAVIVDDGELLEFPLIEGVSAPPARVFWGMNVAQGAQYALLANIDGAPGSEVVSHSRTSPQLHAADGEGTRLDGWPITMTSQTGRRHVVVTDLDASMTERDEGADVESQTALRDLELVTLSGNQLSVITLGPGSYDIRATPWSAAHRDPFGSGAYIGEVDIHQVIVRSAQE